MHEISRPAVTALGLAAALLLGATACAPPEAPTGSGGGASDTPTITAPAEDSTSPAGESSPTGASSPSEDHRPDQDGTAAPGPGSEPLPDEEINARSPHDDEEPDFTFPDTDEVHVVGVPQGSGLNIRLHPGVRSDGDVLASAGPLDTLSLTGREGYFVDEGGRWVEVITEAKNGGDLYGWVNLGYVATLGPASDVTGDVADIGSGPDPEELVLQLADARAPEDEPGPEYQDTGTERTIVRSPRDGAGEWIVDLVGGYRDVEVDPEDTTRGERLAVQLQVIDGRFTVSSVESTRLCAGAVAEDGACS